MAEKQSKEVKTDVRYSPLEIPQIVRLHFNTTPKEPAHFIGEPSTVKSAGVYQEAKQLAIEMNREFMDWNRTQIDKKMDAMQNPKKYFVFCDIRASETDIGELRLQDIKATEDFITFKYNLAFKVVSHEDAQGVLFFDEMNLAANMIKAQFYKIINDHCIGDIPISDGVLCLSAGNEAEHARGVTEDPVPLVLRRGNYFIRPPTSEEYLDYAVKNGHHQFVTGFLAFAGHHVHKIKYDLPDSVGQPCVRTWTKLSNILNSNPKMTKEQMAMVSTGWIGQAVAMEFVAYAESAKKIDLDSILKKPELIAEYDDDKGLSMLYAIIQGVVERFRHDKKIMKSAFEISLHLRRAELGAYMFRQLKNLDEGKFMKAGASEKLIDEALANKVVEKYGKYLFAQ